MAEIVAGAFLLAARQKSGLSQTELARRANVAQSVISAYESGRREPGLSTLSRLVAATGQRLTVGLETGEPDVRGLPDTRLGRRLRQRRAAMIAAAERHGASNLRVFGGVARGEDRHDSDVHLLVDIAPSAGLAALAALESELTSIFQGGVVLATVDGLNPRVRVDAQREAIPL